MTALSPGRYTLETQAPGHKTWRRDIDLLGQRGAAHHDAISRSGICRRSCRSQHRRPRGAIAARSARRSTRQVRQLPLDGRNFLELSLLAPGTAPAAPGSASSVRGDFAFTANGAREDFNSYLLDGVDNVDPKLNTVADPSRDRRHWGVRGADQRLRRGIRPLRRRSSQRRHASGTNVLERHGPRVRAKRRARCPQRLCPGGEPAPEYPRYQAAASVGGPLVRGKIVLLCRLRNDAPARGHHTGHDGAVARRARRRLHAQSRATARSL